MKRSDKDNELYGKLKSEYITTDISYKKMCEKYGLDRNSFTRRATAEKWPALRAEYLEKMRRKADDIAADSIAVMYGRACAVCEKIMLKIEQMLDTQDVIPGTELRAYTASIKDMREMGMLRAEIDREEQRARLRKLEKEGSDEEKHTEIVVTFGNGEEYAD